MQVHCMRHLYASMAGSWNMGDIEKKFAEPQSYMMHDAPRPLTLPADQISRCWRHTQVYLISA